jgi:hypothetical protein
MKKITIYLCVLFICGTTSCTKNFGTINTNPATYLAPSPELIFTGAVYNASIDIQKANQAEFWEFTNMISPNGERNSGQDDNMWALYYQVLGNTRQLKNLYAGNPTYANRLLITDIWECYTYSYLVGCYGPVPYTNAGSLNPVILYDSENFIYTDLIKRLTADMAGMNVTSTGDKFAFTSGATNDVFSYTLPQWVKFANSLRLELALRITSDAGTGMKALAQATCQDALTTVNEAKLIASDADDAKLFYSASGAQSQYYQNYALNPASAPATIPIASEMLMNFFRSYGISVALPNGGPTVNMDPRCFSYFDESQVPFQVRDTLTYLTPPAPPLLPTTHVIVTYQVPYLAQYRSSSSVAPTWAFNTTNINWNLTSQTVSWVNTSVYSQPARALWGVNRPFNIMNYADVCFMKAEAAERYGIGSLSAQQYYTNGVEASFVFWGRTKAEADAYLAVPGVAWNTSSAPRNLGTNPTATQGYFNEEYGIGNTAIPTTNYATVASQTGADANMSRIWIQEWINYYPDNCFDAWCLQRRTQNQLIPPHTNAATVDLLTTPVSSLNDRLAYPTGNEVTVNPTGYKLSLPLLTGSGGIGGVYTGDTPWTPLQIEPNFQAINWATYPVFYDQRYMEKYYTPYVDLLNAALAQQNIAAGGTVAAPIYKPYSQVGTF